ncbi:MAG: hypothetical protein HY080_15140 [Gammaproteobacteria bacterium]|nr:hypothetical protein [Gammaproteobacteria bacterium]
MKYVSLFILACFLLGCDIAKDFKDMGEKQAKVQKIIKEKYGWESQLSWNIQNGVLTQVTVRFSADQVRQETVAKLEDITRAAIATSFDTKPKYIFILISSSAKT